MEVSNQSWIKITWYHRSSLFYYAVNVKSPCYCPLMDKHFLGHPLLIGAYQHRVWIQWTAWRVDHRRRFLATMRDSINLCLIVGWLAISRVTLCKRFQSDSDPVIWRTKSAFLCCSGNRTDAGVAAMMMAPYTFAVYILDHVDSSIDDVQLQ